MKKILSYILVAVMGVFISAFFSLCSIQCDAFDDQYFSLWFPYEMNQTVRFKNDVDTATIITVVQSVDKTGPYKERGWLKMCNMKAEVAAAGSLVMHIIQRQSGNKGTYDREIEIQIAGVTINGRGTADTGVIFDEYRNGAQSTKLLNLNFNNKTYPEAQLLQKTDSFGTPVFELYLAKNKGIIGFRDFSDNKLWALQD